MNTVILYGLSRSVYTRIARLALEEKSVGYTLEEVDIFGGNGAPPEHLERHPFGRIPALRHNGFTLYETGAITRYIDEAFPGPSLQPPAPQQRARMNQVISVIDAYAYRRMIWDVFVQRVSIPESGGTANEALIAEALPPIEACLRALDGLLGDQRLLAGDQLTLADLHATPILLYFALTPEGERMLKSHATLQRWLAEMRTRRSVERTKSIYESGSIERQRADNP